MSDFCNLPITAILARHELLVLGEGPILKVYGLESRRLLQRCQIFRTRSIHGIILLRSVSQNHFLLAWGGRSFKFVEVDTNIPRPASLHLGPEIETQDWVLDAALVPHSSSNNHVSNFTTAVFFLHAHGSLGVAEVKDLEDMRSSTRGDIHFQIVLPASRDVNYSGNIYWLSDVQLLVALGSAFGEIKLLLLEWDGHLLTSLNQRAFIAHQGSIFGVRISPKFSLEREECEVQFLASCSDDRTVRIWNLSRLLRCDSPTHTSGNLGTGFRMTNQHPAEAGFSDTEKIGAGIGHCARVWNVFFHNSNSQAFIDTNKSIVGIVSIGEDATHRNWDLTIPDRTDTGAKTRHFVLKVGQSNHNHVGKHIWSASILERTNDPYDPSIFTGGADGQLACSQVSKTSSPSIHNTWNCYQALNSLAPGKNLIDARCERKSILPQGHDFLRSFAFLSSILVVGITNSGTALVSDDFSQGHSTSGVSWRKLQTFDDLRGYSIASSTEDCQVIFFGGQSSVYMVDSLLCISKMLDLPSRPTSIFPRKFYSPAGQPGLALVVTRNCHVFPELILFQDNKKGQWELDGSVSVPADIYSAVTSTHCYYEDLNFVLVLGTRDGRIHIVRVQIEHVQSGALQCSTSAVQVIEWPHGRNSVTGLLSLESKDAMRSGRLLCSVGRDGTFSIHETTPKRTQLRHKLLIPIGSIIEGLIINRTNDSLYAFGFRGAFFILFDLSKNLEICAIDCGGGHRLWKFQARFHEAAATMDVRLAWAKESNVCVYSGQHPTYQIIREGSHGREIKACAITNQSQAGSNTGPLIATGAEDTHIRLSFLHNTLDHSNVQNSNAIVYPQLRTIAVLRHHVSGIQHLAWSECGNYLFSSASMEQLFVWRLCTLPVLEIGVVQESACPTEQVRPDLRILHFTVVDLKSSSDQQLENTPTKDFLVATAMSNSVIKIYQYKSVRGSGSWTDLGERVYTTACLTKVQFLPWRFIPAGFPRHLLSASTDGYLAVWHVLSHEDSTRVDREPLKTIRLHKSAIKALDMARVTKNSCLVATGGDDGALGIVLFIFNAEKAGQLEWKSALVRRMHAASINYCKILQCLVSRPSVSSHHSSSSKIGHNVHIKLRVLTSGNDQRIKIWDISVDVDHWHWSLSVRRTCNYSSAVADVGDAAVFPTTLLDGSDSILIAGVGIEVWQLKSDRVTL